MYSTRATLAILTIGALAMTGCNKEEQQSEQLSEMAQKLDHARESITRLEKMNADLSTQLEELKNRPVPEPPIAAIQSFVDAAVENIMSNSISDMVALEFRKQVGTQDDIEAIFEQTLEEQMAAAEAREEAERQAEREERQQQWQERRQRQEQARKEAMAEELGLSDQQSEQVATIQSETRTQMREAMSTVWNEKGMDMNALNEARESVTEQQNSRMREVLSSEQYMSYTNSQSQRYGWMENVFGGRSRGRSRGSSDRAPAPPPGTAELR